MGGVVLWLVVAYNEQGEPRNVQFFQTEPEARETARRLQGSEVFPIREEEFPAAIPRRLTGRGPAPSPPSRPPGAPPR